MGALLSRRVRRQQPQQQIAIDWSNPIARGLAIAVNGATPNVNLVTGAPIAAINGGQRLVGKDGIGLAFSSTSALGAQVNTATILSGSNSNFQGGVTVLVLANPSASTTRFLPFVTAQGNQPEWYFQFNANKSLTATSGMFSVQTQGANGATFAGAIDGKTHLFAVVFPDGSTTPRLYVDGVDGTAAATPATNGLLSAANAQDYVGGYKTGGYATTGFSQYLTLAFNRALTQSEIRSLTANPWQLFKPRLRRTWLPRMSPMAYLLQAATAVFGLAGTGVMMTAARRLGVGTGSFGVAAIPASLRAARRLPASSASFALSGAAAAIRAARRVPAQAGAFALSGSVAQMVYTPAQGPVGPTYTLGAAAGSFGLAGNSARLAIGRRLRALLGAFALTGATARLPAARRLPADAGGFVMAGTAAVLRYTGSAGQIDVSQIPASRLVVFEGSGSRVATFDGSGSRVAVFGGSGARTNLNGVNVKLPTLVGTKMTVDRDPDEISHYGADITQELQDRATTAVSVDLVLVGVVSKEQAEIQVVVGDAGSRTYVVAFLAGTDSDPPDGWKWVARVTCANGERFDKTTWFNKVDP